ncbi:MAG: hypothetical protein SH821_13625 [Phototrophicales bacterium]|nr:hypothetical protein [Phototrophicales bacterium]
MNYIPFKGPGFTLERPQAWTLTASLDYQTMFSADVNAWGVRPNVLLSIRPLNDDASLVAVMQEARNVAQKELSGYEVLQEVDQSPDGWVERRYGWMRGEDDLGIVQLQRFYKVGNVLFAFTATRTEYESEYDEVFYHMLESFKLTPPRNN